MQNKKTWNSLTKTSLPIGLGCWQISGAHSVNGKPHGWGEISKSQGINILSKAIDYGVDFFDTAQGYNNGISEQILGQAIRQTNSNPIVCTKIPLNQDNIDSNSLNQNFVVRFEESLKRLNLDQIDILLIHDPPDDTNWRTFDSSILLNLQSQGKIGTFGISSRGLKGAISSAEAGFGTVIEWIFNIFERRPVTELFPIIRDKNINFIARSPLSRGLINPNNVHSIPSYKLNDFRSTLPLDWIKWSSDQLKVLHNNAVQLDQIIELALTYCSQFPEVNSTIVGVRTEEQLNRLIHLRNTLENNQFIEDSAFNGIPECFPRWK